MSFDVMICLTLYCICLVRLDFSRECRVITTVRVIEADVIQTPKTLHEPSEIFGYHLPRCKSPRSPEPNKNIPSSIAIRLLYFMVREVSQF